MSKKTEKILTAYDCQCYWHNIATHTNYCLRKSIEQEYLFKEFAKAGFQHPHVATLEDISCEWASYGKCKDMICCKTNSNETKIRKAIEKQLKCKYSKKNALKDRYDEMKELYVCTQLNDISKRIENLKAIIHED